MKLTCKSAVLILFPILLWASASSAMVLWDQSDWNTVGEGSLNLSSTSCSAISGNTKIHTASDVHFDTPVVINSVKIYEQDGNVAGATQAYLWIAPKTGPLPTESSSLVNNAANLVSIAVTYETNGSAVAAVVTASGLSISLPAGDYWVSLTPRHSRGIFPYSVHYVTSSAVIGDPTPSIVACTVNSDWLYVLDPARYDYAIKIEGDATVPVAKPAWTQVKSLYR